MDAELGRLVAEAVTAVWAAGASIVAIVFYLKNKKGS